MSKRIQYLSDSPCYKCTKSKECMEKIKRSPKLIEISDAIIGNADFDYKDCSLFQSIVMNEKMIQEESNGI